MLLPLGLAVRTAGLRDRLRDLIAMNPAWEAQASAAKLCTAACLTAVGAGGVASPAVVSTVVLPTATPMTVQIVKDKPKPKKKQRAHKPKPTPTVAVAATATWTPTAAPTQAPATDCREDASASGKDRPPTAYPAGGGASDGGGLASARGADRADADGHAPRPQPTAVPTATPTVAPAGG